MKYKIGDYYNLKENQKAIVSKEEVNGYKTQYFNKEEIKWVVLDRNEETGELLLISEKPISQEIRLSGKIGYDNAIEELDRICKEISGVEEARCLRKEDLEKIKYWEDKDDTRAEIIFGKSDEFYYWLASRCVNLGSALASFGVFCVSSGDVDTYDLYFSSNGASSGSYAVRPVELVKEKEEIC